MERLTYKVIKHRVVTSLFLSLILWILYLLILFIFKEWKPMSLGRLIKVLIYAFAIIGCSNLSLLLSEASILNWKIKLMIHYRILQYHFVYFIIYYLAIYIVLGIEVFGIVFGAHLGAGIAYFILDMINRLVYGERL